MPDKAAERGAREAFATLVRQHGMNITSVVMLNWAVAGLQRTIGNAEAAASLRLIADMIEQGRYKRPTALKGIG